MQQEGASLSLRAHGATAEKVGKVGCATEGRPGHMLSA